MANADFPMGFKIVGTWTGGPPVILPGDHYSDGTAAIYPGDAVKASGSGTYVTITATNDNPVAVAANYIAISDTTTELKLYSLRENVFEVQADGSTLTSSVGPTKIGTYFDLTVTTGDTTRLISKQELDDDASTSDTLILLSKANRPDNAWGANVNLLVKFRVDADADVIAVTA
jgi:hypothetical protein